MNPEEYQVMRDLEIHHWWYRGLRAVLSRRLDRTVPHPVSTLLDAGCGTGANLGFFRERFPEAQLTGIDLSPLALAAIRPAGKQTLQPGDVNRLDFENGAFDLVFSANVLSHRKACPRLATAEFFRVLRPKGVLLMNLPALEMLKGEHDEAVHEIRRFEASQVRGLLVATGFEEVECHYWNCLLTPLLWMRRRWTRLRKRSVETAKSDLAVSAGILNGPLSLWMDLEARLACSCPLPFGSSLFVSARKPLSSMTLSQTA